MIQNFFKNECINSARSVGIWDMTYASKTINAYTLVQGDPNQNPLFQMAVPLKLCISYPMLVKPKCVWEAVIFLKNCKQTAEKCKKFFENWK